MSGAVPTDSMIAALSRKHCSGAAGLFVGRRVACGAVAGSAVGLSFEEWFDLLAPKFSG
jgi:hypothetical protein